MKISRADMAKTQALLPEGLPFVYHLFEARGASDIVWLSSIICMVMGLGAYGSMVLMYPWERIRGGGIFLPVLAVGWPFLVLWTRAILSAGSRHRPPGEP